MDLSHLLARIFGITLITVYLSVFLNRRFFERIFQEISQQGLGLFISGFINLLIGLLVVQLHSIWTFDWRGLITLLGWLILISGLVRILFPEFVQKMTKKFADGHYKLYLNITAAVMVLIGLCLSYHGFTSSL